MMCESNVSQDRLREGAVPGQCRRLGRSERCVRCDHRLDDGLGHPPGTRRRHADRRGACHARLLRRVSSSTTARAHVPCRTSSKARRQSRRGRPSSGEPVIVLSHHLWQTLGADPQLVGRTVYVEGRDWRVIGVMPEDFAVPDAAAAFWAPWDMRVSYRGPRFPHGPPRDARFLRVVGRMKAGMSIEGAEARMQTLASGLASEHPDTNAGWSVRLSPLADEIARTSRLELLLVFAAMFCLLLLVCANVASLAIARGVARAQGDGDSPGARRQRQPRHAAVDRRKRVERDRHDGHRHRAHGVVGGRGPVNRARRHSAPARSGHERASRVVRGGARAPGHRGRQRRSHLSRQPHADCGRAQGRGRRVGTARQADCARGWWSPRLPPR